MRALLRRLTARQRPVILMYHRVGTPSVDPWNLAVSPDNFASQLAALSATREIVRLEELVARMDARELTGAEVAITFDDGYADNLHVAGPILREYGAPATLFLLTSTAGSARPFWWDRLARIVLSGRAADSIVLDVARDPVDLTGEPGTADRAQTLHQTWRWLRLAAPSVIEASVSLLEASANTDLPPEEGALAAVDLPNLAASGFTIGGHTRTHPPLTAIATSQAHEEIEGGRRDIEAVFGAAPVGFAYPFGDCNREVAAIVRNAGFDWACTTREEAVSVDCDRYLLPRLAVRDVSGQQLLRRMSELAPAGRSGPLSLLRA